MPLEQKIVLCVDDDADDQLMVLETIRQVDSNYRVASALNGNEALRFLQSAKENNELPCLVIMDINMPLLDGKQTLVRIRKDADLKEVPVVMFTTSSSPMDKIFFEQFGVPCLTKPIKQTELFSTVKKILSYSK